MHPEELLHVPQLSPELTDLIALDLAVVSLLPHLMESKGSEHVGGQRSRGGEVCVQKLVGRLQGWVLFRAGQDVHAGSSDWEAEANNKVLHAPWARTGCGVAIRSHPIAPRRTQNVGEYQSKGDRVGDATTSVHL